MNLQRIRLYIIIFSIRSQMSRGNVFKLSGNNVLGGNSDYQNTDIDEIKNSLKLLKAKKNQRQSSQSQGYGYNLPNQGLPTKNYTPTRNQYNYEMISKNHLPSSQKDFNADYKNKNYQNDYPSYGNKDYGNKPSYKDEPRDYGNKAPSYSQQANTRNTRPKNIPVEDNKYQNYDYNYKESSITNTKSASSNIPRGNRQPQRNAYEPKQNNYENQYYNQREQKSIKEVNRENQLDIVQYDPSELRQCRMGCGRKFNPDSIMKHQKICKKVFQKKRKEFDAQKHRLVDREQGKLMQKGERVEKKIEQMKKSEKVPKWKAQSMEFRSVLKQNRGVQISQKDKQIIQQSHKDTQVQCKFCGRTFNEQAGPRHIKFCQQQAKKNALRKKK